MSISEKIKAINNKIGQNKAQYNLDIQTTKISALLSGNVNKYGLLTGKDILSKKRLARKSCYIKKIWIFSIRLRIKSKHCDCKVAVPKIRQYLWVS